MIKQDLIQAVRDHAMLNYEKSGWDILVECWDDSDISDEIEGAKTKAQAIAKCKKIMRLLNDHRCEVQSTAF